ncbi:MAG: hypothetical protein ABIX28_03365 [Vicinamibacterales bacterium]
MKMCLLGLTTIVAALTVSVGAQELRTEDRALRTEIESRYDVVPLSDGIGLRPKESHAEVRLIEVSDAVSVNGVVVTGRELRDRIGGDADTILKLSYLDPAVRRALFAEVAAPPAQPDAPPAAPASEPDRDRDRERDRVERRSGGDRVRIFGDVSVREGEVISGQVVAVLGSVRIDGEVGDQVVAVLGSVDLGPKAVVRGDIVSVGGRVRRAAGAEVRGGVTEVSLQDAASNPRLAPFLGGLGALSLFDGIGGAFPRLVGTTFRLFLLLLFVSLVMVVARGPVERSAQRIGDNPVKATIVGLLAEVFAVPVLILTCIVLAISIVGIPLLLLVPFAVLFLLILALVGFTGTALAVGQWTRRRFSLGTGSSFADVWLGVIVILFPVLIGRLVGLAGFLTGPIVFLLVAVGFGVEFLAWSTGLGAVLANGFSTLQARRALRTPRAPTA